jgi:hypothetical protein
LNFSHFDTINTLFMIEKSQMKVYYII